MSVFSFEIRLTQFELSMLFGKENPAQLSQVISCKAELVDPNNVTITSTINKANVEYTAVLTDINVKDAWDSPEILGSIEYEADYDRLGVGKMPPRVHFILKLNSEAFSRVLSSVLSGNISEFIIDVNSPDIKYVQDTLNKVMWDSVEKSKIEVTGIGITIKYK